MKYETFNPKRHDILKVASLIYDVDFRTFDLFFRNTKAKNLYEKIGFKEFNKKRVKIGKFERGMYNMELKL